MSNPTAFIPPVANKLTTRKSTVSRTGLPTSSPSVVPVRAVPVSAPRLVTQPQPQPLGKSFGGDPAAPIGGGTGIVLFRSDLRLDDHPALTQALEECSSIVPLFCFDPRHFGRTEHGFDKTGKYRARFLLDAVEDLRTSLRERGSDLVVRIGKPEDVVPQIARSVGARGVYLHREVTFDEQQVEHALDKALSGTGVEAHMLWTNTLYHEQDLPFHIDDMPDVYSDFREAVEKQSKIREPVAAPEEISAVPTGLPAGEIPTLQALGISGISTSVPPVGVNAIRGGEREALSRVRMYVEDSRGMGKKIVGDANNYAHLGADFSCRISPWLALGCVSPRRIFHEMSKLITSYGWSRRNLNDWAGKQTAVE